MFNTLEIGVEQKPTTTLQATQQFHSQKKNAEKICSIESDTLMYLCSSIYVSGFTQNHQNGILNQLFKWKIVYFSSYLFTSISRSKSFA